MKPTKNHRRPTGTELTASTISIQSGKPWYICSKDGRGDVIVSEENLKRYERGGFKVVCAYHKGERYKNLYRIDGRLQFVM